MDYIDEIRQEIVEAFSKHWELNDKAHRQEHFEEVFQTGLVINKTLGHDFDPKHILFAAYFHDLFAWSRVNHHDLSFEFMRTTDHPLILKYLPSHTERVAIACACHEHRASYKGRFFSVFTELVNSADRGRPGPVKPMLERAIQYREFHHPEQSKDRREFEAIKHLRDKYGYEGYARYPDMYEKVFGVELAMMRDKIEQL